MFALRRLLLPNLVLLFAYVASGWLALQIAISPGYVSPLFPPAGLALAAVILRGYGLLPAVYLGSLGIQMLAAAQSGFAPAVTLTGLTVAAGIMAGAALGRVLAERLTGLPLQLDRPASILIFTLLVAPLSCALGASVAVPTLVSVGAFPAEDLRFIWFNWWIGDTLGVLITLPLVMVFFGEPREAWRTRRSAVVIPMLIALGLLGLLFGQVQQWDTNRLRAEFDRDVDSVGDLIRHRLEAQMDQILSLERLATVHPEMDRGDWASFVQPFLSRYPGTQNFAWSPLVTLAARPAYEQAVRREGFPDYAILSRDQEGKTFVAGTKMEYLPITFVEPMASNKRAFGLDPTELDKTREPIMDTRRSHKPAASAPIRLVQETGEQMGVVIYQAVWDQSGEVFLGIVSSALRMGDAMDATLPTYLRKQLRLCLTEPGPQGLVRLYGDPGCEATGWEGKALSRRMLLPFAGREWTLQAVATPAYIHDLGNWSGWATLIFGLLSTGIIGAFLLLISGRARQVEVQVEDRTRQLAEAMQQLEIKQEDLEQAQRLAHIGSWEQVPGGELACSGELRRMLGLSPIEAVHAEDLVAAVHPEHGDQLRAAFQRVALAESAVDLDCRVQIARESPRTLHFRIASFATPGHADLTIHGTAQDVTAARAAEAHIAYLARYDQLTTLPNRTYWHERAENELALSARHGDLHGVLFLDLDQFKSVNDSLGHAVGDRLLTEAAHRLTHCLRDSDLLGRLGGDEFVVLLPRLNHREDAAVVARKLMEAMGRPMTIGEHELTVSVSIGIALYPDDGRDISTLLKHADTAMYSAKAMGRSAFHFFESEMDARALERLMLENALRRAIERNELVLHYQPQVAADRNVVIGCEALVRWQHPELGLLPPTHFISVAEDSGLIEALGEWVLRTACRQQAAWAATGLVLEMAVNISPLQFRKDHFAERVLAIVAESGMDAARLELELTESAVMQPTPGVLARMQVLREHGIGLALDDFGTGYSSLSSLKRLPIERLKIDRGFVRDLPEDAEDVVISSATLSLARDLGMSVVAEGVENEAQRSYLLSRGCTLMQGFLFSPAMPADEFGIWLARWGEAGK